MLDRASVDNPLPSAALQPSSHRLLRPWGWRGGPCNLPELLGSVCGTQQRLRSVRLRLRPTHTATLSNATVLRTPKASTCLVFDCGLDTRDHWKRLGHLAPSDDTLGRCHGSVAGAVGSAVSSMRDKGRRCDASGQGGLCRHAHAAGPVELAGEGNRQSAQRSSSTAKLRRAQSCASETERAIASRSR